MASKRVMNEVGNMLIDLTAEQENNNAIHKKNKTDARSTCVDNECDLPKEPLTCVVVSDTIPVTEEVQKKRTAAIECLKTVCAFVEVPYDTMVGEGGLDAVTRAFSSMIELARQDIEAKARKVAECARLERAREEAIVNGKQKLDSIDKQLVAIKQMIENLEREKAEVVVQIQELFKHKYIV